MSDELIRSNLVNGQKAIQTYARNGLEIPTSPIEEYIAFQKTNIKKGESFCFIYDKSDLRITAIQTDQAESHYGLTITNPKNDGSLVYQTTYKAQIINPPCLLIPKGHKCEITPIYDMALFLLVGIQVSIINISAFQ
jgi:hypothetical protein